VQKIGAQYIGKKLYDSLMAPPPEPVEVAGAADAEEAATIPDLTGQIVTDEEGNPIGRAVRLGDVSVYVVPEPGTDPAEELVRCLEEPGMRLYFQMDGDRITGLIYAPDPARVRTGPAAPHGLRADDV
jgi:hypothetical protein